MCRRPAGNLPVTVVGGGTAPLTVAVNVEMSNVRLAVRSPPPVNGAVVVIVREVSTRSARPSGVTARTLSVWAVASAVVANSTLPAAVKVAAATMSVTSESQPTA